MIVLRAAKKKTKIGDLVFAPGGKLLVAPGWDQRVFVWNTYADGALAEVIPLPEDAVAGRVVFAPDGKTLFAGDDSLYAVDTESHKTTAIPIGEVYTLSFDVSPDGTRLVVAVKDIGYNTELTCWAIGSYKKPLWRQRTTAGHGHTLACLPGTDHFLMSELSTNPASKQFDSVFVTRALATGKIVDTSAPLVDHLEHWVLASDGATLVYRTRDRLHIFSAATRWSSGPQVRHDDRKHFAGMALHPSGRYLAAACKDKSVRLYDPTTCVMLRTLDWDIGKIHSVAFNSDGTRAAAGSDAGKVVVWDVEAVG